MNPIAVLIAFLIQWNCLTPAIGLKECKKISACSCSTDEGIIDLAKAKARFDGIKDAKKAKTLYNWSPCKALGIQYCEDAAVCLHDPNSVLSQPIGKFASANCELSKSGQCTLTYTGNAYLAKSQVKISLECDENEEGKVDPVKSDNGYITCTTTLHSKYVCPSKMTATTPSLSIGSFLLIVFFSLLFVYITAGILFNKYSRGVSGREVFPNYSFWSDFPFLVKDGTVLTFRQCGKLCRLRKSGYAEI